MSGLSKKMHRLAFYGKNLPFFFAKGKKPFLIKSIKPILNILLNSV